jgi:uncharacterized protein (TIGR02246 family)
LGEAGKPRLAVFALAAFGLGWLVAGRALADQADEEAAIRKMIASYTEAFNKGDAKAIAEHWLPEAIYIDPDSGERAVGRAAIEKHFAAEFKELKGAKLTVAVDGIKFISPHVALENGLATVKAGDKEVSKSRYSAIHVKRDGKWLLDRVTEEDEREVVSNYDKLKDLEWMVGTWVDNDDDDDTTIEITCKWAKNQNFLVRSFSMTIRDELDTSGIQIIGWDASAKQIRSWMFDSNGDFSEGFWTRKGKNWQISIKETLANGKKASETAILRVIDRDNFTWQSVDRQVDGQLLPNIAETPVIRKTTTE